MATKVRSYWNTEKKLLDSYGSGTGPQGPTTFGNYPQMRETFNLMPNNKTPDKSINQKAETVSTGYGDTAHGQNSAHNIGQNNPMKSSHSIVGNPSGSINSNLSSNQLIGGHNPLTSVNFNIQTTPSHGMSGGHNNKYPSCNIFQSNNSSPKP
jgi:hypothetical protein